MATETAEELDFVFLEEEVDGATGEGAAADAVVATAVETAAEATAGAGL